MVECALRNLLPRKSLNNLSTLFSYTHIQSAYAANKNFFSITNKKQRENILIHIITNTVIINI